MEERFYGRIVDLVRRYDGDELTADAAIGAVTLYVGDVTDFDEDGGQLVVGDDDPYDYSGIDTDANTIALSSGLVTASAAGDLVKCYDTELGEVVVEYVAHVLMDEQDVDDEPIEVTVPHFLVNYLKEEVRGGAAEAVTLIHDGEDDLMIWQVDGKLVNDIALESVKVEHDDALALLNADLSTLNTVTLPGVEADLATLNGKFPIGTTDISDSAISTPKLAANSVTAAKIVAGTITGDKIAANTIGADRIVANSIGADRLTANAIDGKTVSGMTITGGNFSTVGNWHLDNFGLYNTDLSIFLQTSGSATLGSAAVTGFVTAASVTASGAVHGNTLWSDGDAGGTSSGADMGADGKIKRSTSSRRYKTDIADAEVDVAAVLDIVPATYRRIDEEDGPQYLGVIAEQVAETDATHLVFNDGEGRIEGVHYNALTVSLLAVCKAQQDQIDNLEQRLEALKGAGS